MKSRGDHSHAAGFDPGGLRMRLAQLFAGGGRGGGKKQSGRTPMEPRRAPAHHLNRWRDEGRQALILEAIRLGVVDQDRPAVGPRRAWPRAQFSTWKTLAVAVERARKALDS